MPIGGVSAGGCIGKMTLGGPRRLGLGGWACAVLCWVGAVPLVKVLGVWLLYVVRGVIWLVRERVFCGSVGLWL